MAARGQIHIGPSGWNYREWRDDFYAGVPQRRWLAHCAERFGAIEVNGTFYRLVRAETCERWRDETPEGFVFACKGSRYATHQKRLKEPGEPVGRQRDNLAPLANKLAAMLWQLPARMERDDARLDGFLAALGDWPGVRHAIEFRHESWFDDAVAERLSRAGVAVCLSDSPDWPMWERVTTDLVYVRLHGHTELYRSAYRRDHLARWADSAREWLRDGRTVHIYFDNTDGGAAPRDALTLREMIG